MYLAYLDESGDPGLVNSPTKFFVLACVLVHESNWLSTLDRLKKGRSWLLKRHQIPARAELKASFFRSGSGPFRGSHLSQGTRLQLLRTFVRGVGLKFPEFKAFAVAIEKAKCSQRGDEPRFQAWRFALQRINKFCSEHGERAMLFPDAGHHYFIRKVVRKIRRHDSPGSFYGSGVLTLQADRIVEDPNDRESHESYFSQLVDWLAYAAHRSQHVHPDGVVPSEMWDLLGGVRLLEVNKITGGAPGIVVWPR